MVIYDLNFLKDIQKKRYIHICKSFLCARGILRKFAVFPTFKNREDRKQDSIRQAPSFNFFSREIVLPTEKQVARHLILVIIIIKFFN